MITRAPHVREPLDTTAEIETPEHVRFRYHVAGPAKRAVAYLIDLLLRGAIVIGIALVARMGGAGDEGLAHASSGIVLFVFWLIDWTYYVFCETLWNGSTPGKRALSLRVITESGHPLRFWDSVLRNLVRGADFLPFAYAIGLVVMGRDSRFRRLGDMAAGTIVIVEERSTVAGPLVVDPPPSPAELRALPQRLPLSGDELDAIELFLRRAGNRRGPLALATLSRGREQELGEMAAPIFAARLGIRYKDAHRFLEVLHARAHEHRTAAPVAAPARRKKRGA
jgi:uncharacterized RDD family membrane protein YckC